MFLLSSSSSRQFSCVYLLLVLVYLAVTVVASPLRTTPLLEKRLPGASSDFNVIRLFRIVEKQYYNGFRSEDSSSQHYLILEPYVIHKPYVQRPKIDSLIDLGPDYKSSLHANISPDPAKQTELWDFLANISELEKKTARKIVSDLDYLEAVSIVLTRTLPNGDEAPLTGEQAKRLFNIHSINQDLRDGIAVPRTLLLVDPSRTWKEQK
ncbi:hypothetical protein J3R30DRAFT_3730439 [Lentinula aciculospora]|uniref:Uncharacterized protein n=1 Tax=Lentinula aciculospora TaxID=153920 RepID=A0A9W9DV82_9AGAR|nr:hypothetical protein J3R30DRAFT_3695024 [Lentinula aciculospora]KAJ4488542.1 hypothetical protein J3R30DRAFT_3730439 [Lentinula aciculospora]